MRRIEAIRRLVLKATQEEMAVIAGVKQATVSRWEAGVFTPSLSNAMAIKAAVVARATDETLAGNIWKDEWLAELNSGDPSAVAEDVAAGVAA